MANEKLYPIEKSSISADLLKQLNASSTTTNNNSWSTSWSLVTSQINVFGSKLKNTLPGSIISTLWRKPNERIFLLWIWFDLLFSKHISVPLPRVLPRKAWYYTFYLWNRFSNSTWLIVMFYSVLLRYVQVVRPWFGSAQDSLYELCTICTISGFLKPGALLDSIQSVCYFPDCFLVLQFTVNSVQ